MSSTSLSPTTHLSVGKGKINPITRPGQAHKDPRFQDNRYMKVIRLSALRIGRLYNSVPRVNESVLRWTGSVRNDHIQDSLLATSAEQKQEHILMNLFI
jgi:hypothetical protein